MAAIELRLIRNSKKLVCARCTGIHDYITRLSEDCPCDTPVAFDEPIAKLNARLHAGGDEDVVHIPHELTKLVVLDESARQLPRTGSRSLRLAQFETIVRHA
jgi:hypothetical protein